MHAGKLYPRYPEAYAWAASNFANVGRWLPYALECSFGNVLGSLGTKWDGLVVVSLPGRRESDQVWYDFVCPTDPLSIFRFKVEMVIANPGTSFTQMRWLLAYEFWDGGLLYGDSRFPFYDTQVLLKPSSWTNFGSWFNLLSPPLFSGTSACPIYVANWEDVPDYRPYKTEP